MAHTLTSRDPIGVVPPGFTASAVLADWKLEQAAKKTFHPERAPIVLGQREAEKRARLFAQARAGSGVAIRALAQEYRLRLIVVGAVGN